MKTELYLDGKKLSYDEPFFLPAICMLINSYSYSTGQNPAEVAQDLADVIKLVNEEMGTSGVEILKEDK